MNEKSTKHPNSYKHNNAVRHKVLDCTIQNLAERNEKAVIFDTAKEVMLFLGIGNNKLVKVRGINGGRVIREKDGKEYAVRYLG